MSNIQDYVTLFLIWLISTLFIKSILNKFKRKPNLPPSPFPLPILGHLHLLSPLPHQSLHNLATKHGALIYLKLGSVPCIVASTPQTAKSILKTHETSFLDRPVISAVDHLTYGSADFSFAPYGPYWKFMKKICMTELLGGRMLGQLEPVRAEEVRRLVEVIHGKVGREVDVGGELMRMTNNVVSRSLLGRRCTDEEEVRRLVSEVAEITGRFNLSDYVWFLKGWDLQGFGKRLKEIRGRFDELVDGVVEEKRRKSGGDGGKDMLDLLLGFMEDEKAEMRLTKENVKAFIMDIFAAGTDTSAITTEWALSELINHPEILRKVRQEIHSIVGPTRLIQESDIPNLPYLQAIVKETLRLHPTGPMIVRESTEDCNIDGYDIPARTRVFINVWALGRDPNHWADPIEFRPERFVGEEGQSAMDVRGQFFQLLPFGSGRRSCPGISLAMYLVQVTVGVLVQCFDWEVEGGGRVGMEEGPGLTLPRAKSLVCVPVVASGSPLLSSL